MANILKLKAEPRSVTGKKVKQLRRAGLVPGNVYGHGIESIAVQVDVKELQETLRHATATTLVDLSLGSGRPRRSVLLRDVQWGLIKREPQHVDFFAVRMDEKLRAAVALVFHGEAPGVKNNEAMLLHSMTELNVEGLPGDLPEAIEVDVSELREIDQAIHVRDLELPEGVTLLDDPDELVCKVQLVKAAIAETPTDEAAEGDQAAGESDEESEERGGGA